MTPFEAYDKAKQERKWARGTAIFNVVLIALLVLAYTITIHLKGWKDDYLLGLVGFALLGFNAYLKWREYQFWIKEIEDFEASLTTFGGWCPPIKEER